jgi:hypothetical protein
MNDYDRPRSMADAVVEQATAAPGEYRVTRRYYSVQVAADWLDHSDADLGRLIRAQVLRAPTVVDL